ncbi:MAG: glycine--tRNA ligase [bacterium]|nr:glycine--tRNA ligase [bacterium]
MKDSNDKLMDKIISLCKRRGFIFPGSEIYGGLQNSWDFGPLGVALKKNIKAEWWKRFVQNREDIVGLDAAILMNPKVWEASGHSETFSDPLVECKECHTRFRLDENGKSQAPSTKSQINSPPKADPPLAGNGQSGKCPNCGKENLTEAQDFNLMLKTSLGATEGKGSEVYFRPETAQGIFVNFKNILNTTRKRIPFGIAQIGKAFRNEITPGNFIFRTREFEQMEIEYFVREDEWESWFTHWLDQIKQWNVDLGLDDGDLEYVEVSEDERAHYSKRTVDIEYKFPFGQKELYGLAYRTDHDLKAHIDVSGEDLKYMNPDDSKDRFVPHVIEPSFGVERTVLAVMLSAYREENISSQNSNNQAPNNNGAEEENDVRVILKFPYWVAPVKVAVLPLMKKDGMGEKAKEVFDVLKLEFDCEYDESGSIGKRYRRQDEIGTPFCVTIDHDTLENDSVTVRDRDSLEQERVAIADLAGYISGKLNK